MFYGELKTNIWVYDIRTTMSIRSLFREQPVKVLGDKRYFIFNIERIYHPDTIF